MYLNELLCVLGILAFTYADLRMGLLVYEKYVSNPRNKEIQRQQVEIGYLRAKLAEKAMRKSVNDRIRRAKAKNLVKFSRPAHKKERMVA